MVLLFLYICFVELKLNKMEKSIKEKIVDIVSEYAGNVSEDVENRLDMVLEGLHDNILEWLRSTYTGGTFYKFDEYLDGLLLGDEEELKPCPFCGSDVKVSEYSHNVYNWPVAEIST